MSANASANAPLDAAAAKRAEKIRQKFKLFRALVLGQANSGKTTLLQKVCNTTEQPEIFDMKGNKVRVHQLRKLTSPKIIVLRLISRS
jgi:septin family protein